MRPKQKLSLYIKFINKSDQIRYSITPDMLYTTNIAEENIYQCQFDSGDMHFAINLESIAPGQALVVTKIKINNIDLTTGLDKFGTYKTAKGKNKKTYGYMDEAGIYNFKIRYNVMYTQYMTYLLGQITK